MVFCVNTHSREFKNTAKRLNISEAFLEKIIHEYINTEGNAEAFPSDSYIQSKVSGEPLTGISEKAQKLIDSKYSRPITVDNYTDAQAVMADMAQYFDPKHIGLKETYDGKYEVTLAEVSNEEVSDAESKDIFESINDKMMQEIMETESDISSIQKELNSLDRKAFINQRISNYNDLVKQAQRELKRGGRVTSNGLHSFIDDFNSKYSALIQSGIIDKLDNRIADKISVFDDTGRVYYDISKAYIRRNIEAIKAAASEQLRTNIANLNKQLTDAVNKLNGLKKASVYTGAENLFYQTTSNVADINAVTQRLKPINKKLGAIGSVAKVNELLKRADIPEEVRNTLTEAYKEIPSIKNLTPYEALQFVASSQYKGLVAQYNESIRRPENEKLERLLTDYLAKYGFEINIGDAVKQFGDVTGVLDIINKIIYVANNRNETTLPEEFGHAFVELLGSTISRREENKDFTFLMNTVENTELYKQVYEQYKDVYKKPEGTPDIYKIKKEAIGQGIGLAILSQYNGGHEETRTFLQRLKDFVERILNKFRGSEYLSFESLVNKMAEEVLEGSTKRLEKIDQSDYKLLDYYKTIEEQNKKDGGKALRFMQYFTSLGNQITGSLAYRLQGTVYRPGIDSLHDIDMHVPMSAHGINFENALLRSAIMAARARNQEQLFNIITNNEYFSRIKKDYPKIRFGAAYPDSAGKNRVTVNAVYSEDTSLSERFLKMSGSYAERLKNFTEEERGQIYLFDFFLQDKEDSGFFEPTYELALSYFDTPIREKRWMGRAKDIMDYQNWRVFDEYKNKVRPSVDDLMYQVTSTPVATQTETKEATTNTQDQVGEDGLSIPEAEPVREELLKFQESADRTNKELNNVLNSDLISNEEVRKVGEKVVYFISDFITELLEDPSKVFSMFQSLATRDGKPMTEEQRNEEIEKIKQMSRVELARYVGIQRLIDFAVNRLFTVGGNARFAQLATRRSVKKANLIKENINTILKFAKNAFLSVENFTLAVDNGEISITEDVTPDSEEFNNENDVDSILENEGNLQEHWQIISRTQEAIASMSQLVKSVLNRCFQLKVNEETGAIEKVEDDFGIAERMDVKDATASILKWTIGAESLSHMVEMLEEKAVTNPWVQQVVDKLKDTSGKEADFQSQFYGVFAKSFQPYSIVLRERNEKTGQYEYKSIAVNQHPALTDATKAIEVAYKTNNHPLFLDGKVRRDALDTLASISQDLVEMAKTALENNDRAKLVNLIAEASVALGYPIEYSDVNLALDNNKSFKDIVGALSNIVNNLKRGADRENYDPFTYGKENSISGYLKNFLTPLTAKLEETAVSSFYDSGRMYQSYVAPSYLTVLMNKFQSSDERFAEFLENEYGKYEWFRNADGTWKNLWLERLANLSEEQRKDLFKHKVQLNFNKHNYMKNMSDVEYGLSILTEFFSAFDSSKGSIFKAWFRVPIMSNKPSSEFLMMEAYTGKFMETMLLDGFSRIFQQELGRVQTVEIRDYNKKNPNFIKNFDKNGKKFIMLDFFNQYLRGGKQANSELGRLINKAIQEGTEFDAKTKRGLTSEENARMLELVSDEIKTNMDAKAERIISEWRQNGIFEGAKQIKNIGTDDAVVEKKLREFIWNDAFASMNILELTITDPAFYKDSEDLQKRLAQIHAPGTRANVEATDYEGNKVTDGKFRTVLLKDFDDFVSNIKDNLRVVFDKKLKELRDSGVDTESSKYKAAATTYQSIIDQFNKINVADAQGYSSPTSYRKKAFIFGKWSRASEEIYQKLKRNIYTYSDLQTAFQPLKPFVYGQIEKPSIDNDRTSIAKPLSKLKVPVQFKNSEYLLIMADAILQGENTGKPNLLRAVYEVMEESAEKHPGRGIDTIQFESTCKSGLMAPIDIKQYYNAEGGEILAKQALENAIYNPGGSYNSGTYVYEVPFENYAIQQEVPEHFKNHYQAHGSQIRYIIPSDLESVDSDGNAVTYNYFDRGEEKKLSAEDFRREYEQNISENIEASLSELSEQLGLGDYYLSQKDRNIALSKVLLDEIYRSPRYGVELAAACTVNSETGKFNIPLGDPIQSKRIEQLINSIVKNRVNKQEVAGGPVVQVTNFGTSKELNIRFSSKEGGLLMTRAEFENSGTEGTYEDYVKQNQAGIAYFEVFAPIFANEFFEKFADKNGNIDIETIEKINPDLLKMIGYRIPTEDKYSMAPLKIVGFLPREAGDGIMLPNDITLLTGSDFDVDKFYLMRKEIGITRRFLGDMSSYTVGQNSEVQVNKASIRKELLNKLETLYQRNMKLPEATKGRVEERADIIIEGRIEEAQKAKESRYNNSQYHIDALNRQKDERLKRAQEDYDRNADVIEKAFKEDQISEEEYNERMNKLDESFDKKNKSIEDKFQAKLDKAKVPSKELTEEEISKIKEERGSIIYDLAKTEQKELIRRAIDDFLEDPNRKATNALMQDIKNAYIEYMYDYVEDTEGTTYRNNKIVDMSWAVLTNETTASKMLTPGGFDPEKSMGYLVSAYQNPANNFTWEELLSLENREKGLLDGKIVDLDPDNSDIETGIDALKSLCYTEKNLSFIDTHLQFYKQNSAAATALGMAAVQKIGHAVLESDGFTLNVSEILSLDPDEFISIAGKEFSGLLEVDAKYNDEGDLIGRTLGEFVAMFADAVKDPVANLMNINNTTMPIITSMIRLGMPFRDAALFVSQPAIRRVLNLYNSENVTNFATLTSIVEKQIKAIQERYGTEEGSYIEELNTLSKEELINALNPRWREQNSEDVDVTDYKVLKFFLAMDKISKALKPATFATRFNSISNAVGPLVVDNLIMEYKASQELKGIYDRDGNEASFGSILTRHPILGSFYKTLNMSREILDEMPTNSNNFRAILSSADADLQRILYGDRKLLSTLADFYQSYLLIASGAIPAEATTENKYQGLKYYIEQFPSDFMRGNAKELFKGNKLIDAIKLDIQRGRAVLRVDTTGLSPLDKERLSDGWVDLYKSGERGKKLAEHLFYYNFFRTGIGFSPKSFMNLFPTRLKSYILGYNETFDVHNFKFAENITKDIVLDQFIRNNADNNKLAPRVKFGKDGLKPEMNNGTYVFKGNDYFEVSTKPYMKVKINGADVLLKRMTNDKDSGVASFVALSLLGNNGEYFEASLNRDYTPLTVPSTTREQRSEGELEEVSVAETESGDVIPSSEITPAEENKRLSFIRNALIKAFELTGRTTEQAKAKIQEFKDKPEADKRALKGQMKKWLRNKFEALGIEVDEKLVDEAYEELC